MPRGEIASWTVKVLASGIPDLSGPAVDRLAGGWARDEYDGAL